MGMLCNPIFLRFLAATVLQTVMAITIVDCLLMGVLRP